MMTLRDLFGVLWTITEIEITARASDSHYLHRWIYGPEALQKETRHQFYDRQEGKLTIVETKINAHGDETRGGAEMGWGVKEKLFPAALIDAPVTHLGVMNIRSGEHRIYADVELPELTVMTLIPQEERSERVTDDSI